jgi:hypothetical protein
MIRDSYGWLSRGPAIQNGKPPGDVFEQGPEILFRAPERLYVAILGFLVGQYPANQNGRARG